MPEVRLQLVAVLRVPDDSVQDLPLAHLGVALAVDAAANPLRFYLILLLQDGLQPVEAHRRSCAAVIVAVDEGPDVLLRVVEHRWMSHPSHESCLDQML